MAKFRVNKTKDYTVVPNHHLKDKTISLKAKGLLTVMLSLSDNWDYSIIGLNSISKEGVKAIRSTLNELKEHRYLVIRKFNNDKGQYEYIYDIYEEPYTPKGDVVKGYAVKGTQLNTKELNTNNKDKLDKPLNSITNELIKRKFIESSDLELFRYDDLFNEILTKCEYRDVIIVVSYIIQKWNENKGLDEDNNKIMDKFNYFKKSLENNLEMITEDIDLGWD